MSWPLKRWRWLLIYWNVRNRDMSIVIKEIVVRTKVEKTVYRPEELPEELVRRLKQELLEELGRAERRRMEGKTGKER